MHSQQLKGQRPKPFPEHDLYFYYPGTSRIDNEAAVNVRMRPFSVISHAVFPEGGAEGVLIAQGGRFAGWSLFALNGKLVYEHNFVGLEHYRVTSDVAIPSGKVTLGMEFTITGQFEITRELTDMDIQGVNGRATLYINDKAVGSGMIEKTVPFGWSLSGEGLCCGFDSETPVSDLFEASANLTRLPKASTSTEAEPVEEKTPELEQIRFGSTLSRTHMGKR